MTRGDASLRDHWRRATASSTPAEDPVEVLTAFAERVRLGPRGALVVDELTIEGKDRRATVVDALASCLYERVYTRAGASVAPLRQRDLTSVLAAANATKARWEHDWSLVEQASNGSIIAARFGRTRRFAPGEFLLASEETRGRRRVSVHLAGGSAARQPGFYHCFSDEFRESNDQRPIIRLYFHTCVDRAPPLCEHLTRTLNRYRLPFLLKMAIEAADYARADNTVLYVVRDNIHVVLQLLAASMDRVAPCLAPTVPLMTLRLTAGIGLAEDPGGGESFGSARCKLAAGAMMSAIDGGRVAADRFVANFDAAAVAVGLRPETLHLNPGSDDIYTKLAGLFDNANARDD